MITFDDFLKVDIRAGVILDVEDFPRARNPSYRVRVDFGPEVGIRHSAMQATHYSKESLIGMTVVGVVNLPPRNIAGFMSEVLILGVPDEQGRVALLSPTLPAPPGGRMY